jgi:ABC-type polysaccharide/polyol phosphate export permease
VAGITKVEMVVSQLIVNTFALIVMNFSAAISALLILDIHITDGNELYLALLVILLILFGQYIAFFMAALFNNFSTLAHIVTGVTFLAAFVCGKSREYTFKNQSHCNLNFPGVYWPVEGQPSFLKFFTSRIPFTKCVAAFRILLLKKTEHLAPIVKEAYISCTVWILLLIILSSFVIKFKHKN